LDALPELLGDPESWVNLNADVGIIDADITVGDKTSHRLQLKIPRRAGISEILKLNDLPLKSLRLDSRAGRSGCFVAGYGVSRRLQRDQKSHFGPRFFRTPRANAVGTLFVTLRT